MRLDKILIIAKKDWKEIFSSKFMFFSLLATYLIPLIFPTVLIGIITVFQIDLTRYVTIEEIERLKRVIPTAINLDGIKLFVYLIGVMLTPFLFVIFSLASTSIITADSFAGEKERKTIEALFAAPITDVELFMGKLMVSFIPSICLTYLFFTITSIIINFLTYDVFGYLWYPTLEVILLIGLITPLYAFLGMTLVIWGSSRATSVKDAGNYAGILVIPVVTMFIGVSIGMIAINIFYLWITILILLLIDIIVFYLSLKTFNRERIIITV